MRLTYRARAPSLWQDYPANRARPAAAEMMTLLEFVIREKMLGLFGDECLTFGALARCEWLL